MIFALGRILATPGAIQALEEAGANPVSFLLRHANGDWGDLSEEDKRENDLSVGAGFRILSAYKLRSGVTIWVITEADRSVTTFLLPQEY